MELFFKHQGAQGWKKLCYDFIILIEREQPVRLYKNDKGRDYHIVSASNKCSSSGMPEHIFE